MFFCICVAWFVIRHPSGSFSLYLLRPTLVTGIIRADLCASWLMPQQACLFIQLHLCNCCHLAEMRASREWMLVVGFEWVFYQLSNMLLGHSVLNQPHFRNSSSQTKTFVNKKAKILISWMHVNKVIHYFVEGQNEHFHLRF